MEDTMDVAFHGLGLRLNGSGAQVRWRTPRMSSSMTSALYASTDEVR